MNKGGQAKRKLSSTTSTPNAKKVITKKQKVSHDVEYEHQDDGGAAPLVNPDESIYLTHAYTFEPGCPYVPQLFDSVMYFRQGHEKNMEEVYKFSGTRSSDFKLPFMDYPDMPAAVECKITEIKYKFCPTTRVKRSMCSLTMSVVQPFESDGEYISTMLCDYVEMQMADFLVLKSRYLAGQNLGLCVGKQVEVMFDKDWWAGEIQTIEPIDPDFPDSPWEQIKVLWHDDSISEISCWEVRDILPDTIKYTKTVDQRLLDLIDAEMNKFAKTKTYKELPYIDWKIYPNPLLIATLQSRIQNRFYRSIETFEQELDHIAHCLSTIPGVKKFAVAMKELIHAWRQKEEHSNVSTVMSPKLSAKQSNVTPNSAANKKPKPKVSAAKQANDSQANTPRVTIKKPTKKYMDASEDSDTELYQDINNSTIGVTDTPSHITKIADSKIGKIPKKVIAKKPTAVVQNLDPETIATPIRDVPVNSNPRHKIKQETTSSTLVPKETAKSPDINLSKQTNISDLKQQPAIPKKTKNISQSRSTTSNINSKSNTQGNKPNQVSINTKIHSRIDRSGTPKTKMEQPTNATEMEYSSFIDAPVSPNDEPNDDMYANRQPQYQTEEDINDEDVNVGSFLNNEGDSTLECYDNANDSIIRSNSSTPKNDVSVPQYTSQHDNSSLAEKPSKPKPSNSFNLSVESLNLSNTDNFDEMDAIDREMYELNTPTNINYGIMYKSPQKSTLPKNSPAAPNTAINRQAGNNRLSASQQRPVSPKSNVESSPSTVNITTTPNKNTSIKSFGATRTNNALYDHSPVTQMNIPQEDVATSNIYNDNTSLNNKHAFKIPKIKNNIEKFLGTYPPNLNDTPTATLNEDVFANRKRTSNQGASSESRSNIRQFERDRSKRGTPREGSREIPFSPEENTSKTNPSPRKHGTPGRGLNMKSPDTRITHESPRKMNQALTSPEKIPRTSPHGKIHRSNRMKSPSYPHNASRTPPAIANTLASPKSQSRTKTQKEMPKTTTRSTLLNNDGLGSAPYQNDPHRQSYGQRPNNVEPTSDDYTMFLNDSEEGEMVIDDSSIPEPQNVPRSNDKQTIDPGQVETQSVQEDITQDALQHALPQPDVLSLTKSPPPPEKIEFKGFTFNKGNIASVKSLENLQPPLPPNVQPYFDRELNDVESHVSGKLNHKPAVIYETSLDSCEKHIKIAILDTSSIEGSVNPIKLCIAPNENFSEKALSQKMKSQETIEKFFAAEGKRKVEPQNNTLIKGSFIPELFLAGRNPFNCRPRKLSVADIPDIPLEECNVQAFKELKECSNNKSLYILENHRSVSHRSSESQDYARDTDTDDMDTGNSDSGTTVASSQQQPTYVTPYDIHNNFFHDVVCLTLCFSVVDKCSDDTDMVTDTNASNPEVVLCIKPTCNKNIDSGCITSDIIKLENLQNNIKRDMLIAQDHEQLFVYPYPEQLSQMIAKFGFLGEDEAFIFDTHYTNLCYLKSAYISEVCDTRCKVVKILAIKGTIELDICVGDANSQNPPCHRIEL